VDDAKAPLEILRFLYAGSSDVAKDLDYCTKVLGAKKVWDFSSTGTRVAAVRVSSGPLLLLAGHRPAPSVLPVFEVGNLKASAREFKGRGWQSEGEEFEIPNGPCYLFKDPQREPDGRVPGRPSEIVGERIPRDWLANKHVIPDPRGVVDFRAPRPSWPKIRPDMKSPVLSPDRESGLGCLDCPESCS